MTLRVHNTLTRSLEEFRPLREGRVGMYVCGMTIYDLCHMGHLRMMMAFDVVYRWLCALGFDVTYVRNITDIEDKIIKRALERKITIRELTDEMIAAMRADLAGTQRMELLERTGQCVVDAQGHRCEKRGSGLGADECRRPLGRIETQYSGPLP